MLSFFDDGYLEEYDQEKILNDVGFYTNGGVITEKNQSQFGDGGAALSNNRLNTNINLIF